MDKQANDRVLAVINEAKMKLESEKVDLFSTDELVHRYRPRTIGDILLDQKKITEDQLRDALREQQVRGDKVGKILVDNEVIEANELTQSLALQLDLPYLNELPVNDIDASLVNGLSISYCKQYLVVPISKDATGVTIAVYDALNLIPVDELRLMLGTAIYRVVCPKAVIESAINSVFERQEISAQDTGLTSEEDEDIAGLDDADDLLHDQDEAPVRKEVSTIIRRAIAERASDIHIEPYEDRVVVRFRIDGKLREVRNISKKFQSSVTTRIKIIGRLNIAESRIPQDGRIAIKVGGRECDVRLSTLPCKFGERVVMRILDKSKGVMPIEKLGIPEVIFKPFERMLHSEHGIVLVTGPTGSGKTSTLASCLMHINHPDVNIITVEDPVEYVIPGTSQVEVNDKAGLTFAASLRSILRQDPNVILIGEIRDKETCQIAVQAAITGHLVFSTLHTNDTAATITRLADFGIEPFQITTSLLGVLAVRLMPRLCAVCKEQHTHSAAELALIGLTPEKVAGRKLFKSRPSGCPACRGMGYNGRMGIYEFLPVNHEVRKFILQSSDGASLKRQCVQGGMKTLRDSAIERFLQGDATLLDAVYSTQTDEEGE